jgi:hypothetical protein
MRGKVIANFQLPIANLFSALKNWQSAIGNRQLTDGAVECDRLKLFFRVFAVHAVK